MTSKDGAKTSKERADMSITRDVTIEREGRFWLVYIDGTDGLTQARNYREVELMAREYICLTEDVPLEEVTIGAINVKGVG